MFIKPAHYISLTKFCKCPNPTIKTLVNTLVTKLDIVQQDRIFRQKWKLDEKTVVWVHLIDLWVAIYGNYEHILIVFMENVMSCSRHHLGQLMTSQPNDRCFIFLSCLRKFDNFCDILLLTHMGAQSNAVLNCLSEVEQ